MTDDEISPLLRSTAREAEIDAIMAEWRATEIVRISSLTSMLRVWLQQMTEPTRLSDGTILAGFSPAEVATLTPYLMDRIWPISYEDLTERVEELSERMDELDEGVEEDDDTD